MSYDIRKYSNLQRYVIEVNLHCKGKKVVKDIVAVYGFICDCEEKK